MPRTRSRTASARATRLGLCFFTVGLLPFKVNPPVLIWDAATTALVVVVQVGRQDHRLGLLRLCFGASHATRVAAVSSVTPGGLYRPTHQHPARQVEERQAASRRFLTHDLDHLVDPLRSLALVWPPCVHLLRHSAALARWRRVDAEPFQQPGELGARAASR